MSWIRGRRDDAPPDPPDDEPPPTSRDEVRLSAALEELSIGVIVEGREGEELFVNRVAAGILEAHDRRTLVAETLRDVTRDARAGRRGRQVVDIFGPPAESYAVSARPLADGADGEVVAFIENVSERQRLDQIRRDFVANISHELKTPIGAVGLLADTLVDETDPDVVARLSARLSDEVERVSKTIDDLLELSRIEFGEDAEFEDLTLTPIVEEAAMRLSTAAEARGVGLELETDALQRVHGDRRQLVSAVANLVDNAVKYSPDHEVVVVRTRDRPEGGVEIEVEDRGTGIPGRDLDRIFERFYRVDRGRGRGTGGTGLGLAIVRHVAQNHRGTATVSSREGRGSTFTLTLPGLAT